MSSPAFDWPTYRRLFWGLVIIYVAFAGTMIFRSSAIGIDGRRYFSLFDDAMISMRYADNWVRGQGLVWNPGELVEGFSNPFYVLVMAVCITLLGQNHGVLAMQVLGAIIIILGGLFLVVRISHRLLSFSEHREAGTLLCAFMTAAFYPFLYWSIMGMETGLLTVLLLWSVWLILDEPAGTKVNRLLCLALATSVMTRMDSLLLVLVVLAFRLRKRIAAGSGRGSPFTEGVLIFLPMGIYEAFRLHYCGMWVPNTYILKATGMGWSDRVRDGLSFFRPFLVFISGLVLVVGWYLAREISRSCSGLAKKAGHPTRREAENEVVALSFALFLGYAAYQIAVGGDPWPPYWRFTVPQTILLFVVFVYCMWRWAADLRVPRFRIESLAVLLALVVGSWTFFTYRRDLRQVSPYQARSNQLRVNVALVLNEILAPQATVASLWGGTIPFYTRRRAFDPLGKMDPRVARLPPDTSGAVSWGGMRSVPGHNKYDLRYTYEQLRPDYIQRCRWGRQNLEDWCREHYTFVKYRGVRLILKRDSGNIDWSKIGSD